MDDVLAHNLRAAFLVAQDEDAEPEEEGLKLATRESEMRRGAG